MICKTFAMLLRKHMILYVDNVEVMWMGISVKSNLYA